jgi:drug/metabolite transporter (DMT)-like permease
MQALSMVGVVTLAMTLLGWSSIPLFLKHFSGSMDAWSANGWRYGFSALLWLPVIVHQFTRRTLPKGIWRAAVVPSVLNTTGQAAFAWAPYFIDPGLMTFGLRTQILFVAIGAYLMFPSERRVLRSRAFLAAMVVVFAGAMGTLALARLQAAGAVTPARAAPGFFGRTLTQAQATGVGISLSVASGALFAGYALAVRKYMHGIHPVTAFATICQYTGIGMVVMMLALAPEQGWYVTRMESSELWLLALSAIVGIALGHVFYYTSIARLGVAVSSGVIQLQPILVAVASYFLFGEVLSPGQWGCGMLAVGAAMVMLWVQHSMGKADAGARAAATAGPEGD